MDHDERDERLGVGNRVPWKVERLPRGSASPIEYLAHGGLGGLVAITPILTGGGPGNGWRDLSLRSCAATPPAPFARQDRKRGMQRENRYENFSHDQESLGSGQQGHVIKFTWLCAFLKQSRGICQMKAGDRVIKDDGIIPSREIIAVFTKRSGVVRFAVEDDRGVVMIMRSAQLRLIDAKTAFQQHMLLGAPTVRSGARDTRFCRRI
jgi:hypothetical protein